MNRTISSLAKGVALAIAVTTSSVALSENGEADGNRYFLERYYPGEISAAKAFLETVVKRGKWSKRNRADRMVIVDVRDATEYKLGHPEGAYHHPFPRIFRECAENPGDETDTELRTEDGACKYGTRKENGVSQQVLQSPEGLFLEIEARFPDKTQRMATLCRTGFRSVRAANILTKPEVLICEDPNYTGDVLDCKDEYSGRGYERVYNIWQGFVGQPMPGVYLPGRLVAGLDDTLTPLTLEDGTNAFGFVAIDLDLNNDGEVDAQDKDGWRYHQGLPYDTRLLRKYRNASVLADGYYDEP